MADSYVRHGILHEATFELFVRDLPAGRAFLVACGVGEAVAYLEALRFDPATVSKLAAVGRFSDEFLDYLGSATFAGDAWAVREGDVVFAGEPILAVTAPLPVAQVVETYLLNCISSQTMVASKAARVSIACQGRSFVEFGARRVHGVDAALRAARAAVVGGAVGTSLVSAGAAYGIPLSGTMAHSFVQSFPDEVTAFRTYARDHPDDAILLVDTYDTPTGARHAAAVATELRGEGIRVRGVRLDSGDLVELSRAVRGILDDAGLADLMILASGDLDEAVIAELVAAGAPIDAFGVGTQLGTSADHPWLSAVYKLVEDEDGPKMKLAPGKLTLPGAKQVYRFGDHDVLALRDEEIRGGQPVLAPTIVRGRRLEPVESLDQARARREESVAALPAVYRSLERPAPEYDVRRSAGLQALLDRLVAAHG